MTFSFLHFERQSLSFQKQKTHFPSQNNALVY